MASNRTPNPPYSGSANSKSVSPPNKPRESKGPTENQETPQFEAGAHTKKFLAAALRAKK